jgi:hypothetical protein
MLDTTKRAFAAPGPSDAPVGGRGHADMVMLRTTAYLEVVIEGGSLAAEALDAASVIHAAAASGNRALVVNEAGRLASKAAAYRERFRQWADEVRE